MNNKKGFLLSLFFLLFFNLNIFAASSKRDTFIECGKAYMGVPYLYGGSSRSGMDCSGFVYRAAKDAGLSLPRTAAEMYRQCTKITDSERKKGDLVFFTVGSSITHVGIYIGNNQMLNSASDGPRTGVIISKLSENYWKTHYYCAGRFINDTSSSSSKSSSSSSSSPSSDSDSSKKTSSKTKIKLSKSDFFINFNGYFDWSFYTPINTFGFWPKGGTLQAEAQLHMWQINPGIMVRYTYPIQSYDSFDTASLFKAFNLPICLTIHINDYVAAYAGVVLSTGIVASENQKLLGTDKLVQPPIFPGIFGVSFQTPKVRIGSVYASLVQDISYTHYKAVEGYDSLSFQEALAQGVNFSTGISITLPF